MSPFGAALWLVLSMAGTPVSVNFGCNTQDFTMRQGWYNGKTVMYVPFAASNIHVAQEYDHYFKKDPDDGRTDYVPNLAYANLPGVVNDVYIIGNTSLVVFSSEPGRPDYTPLWRVQYLNWKPGAVKVPVHSAAEVQDAINNGLLLPVTPNTSVLDATIVQKSDGVFISQALGFEMNPREQEIELPVIKAFYFGQIGRRWMTIVVNMALTDASDPDLANTFKANYAPQLAFAFPLSYNPAFAFAIPTPPAQNPIVTQIQQYRPIDWLQINQQYNPIKSWTIFDRSALPPTMTVTTPNEVTNLLGIGAIAPINTGNIVTNSPILLRKPAA